MGVGLLGANLNEVREWPPADWWSEHRRPAHTLHFRVRRYAAGRDVAAELHRLAERVGEILHTMNIQTDGTALLSQMVGE